jgi:hypothetical protein
VERLGFLAAAGLTARAASRHSGADVPWEKKGLRLSIVATNDVTARYLVGAARRRKAEAGHVVAIAPNTIDAWFAITKAPAPATAIAMPLSRTAVPR